MRACWGSDVIYHCKLDYITTYCCPSTTPISFNTSTALLSVSHSSQLLWPPYSVILVSLISISSFQATFTIAVSFPHQQSQQSPTALSCTDPVYSVNSTSIPFFPSLIAVLPGKRSEDSLVVRRQATTGTLSSEHPNSQSGEGVTASPQRKHRWLFR